MAEEGVEEVNPIRIKLGRNRKALDAVTESITELVLPVHQALDEMAPVPMNPLQIKRVLNILHQLAVKIDTAGAVLAQYELNVEAAKRDNIALKETLKVWNQAEEAVQTLQAITEATQHLTFAEKTVTKMEKKREDNPALDCSRALAQTSNRAEEARVAISRVGLSPDNLLWEKLELLEDRIQDILSVEVKPAETKELYMPYKKPPYKMTDLAVPKFSGRIEHYIDFWEEFQHAVDKKTDLDNCTKLLYLKQSILDPGLKSTIADLGIKDDSYSAAVRLLKDRFNKPRVLHRQYCEALKCVPVNEDTRVSITKMADQVQHLLTGLTRIKSLGASEILTSIAELSMSKELKHLWLTHTSKVTTTPPVEDLLVFLREKADQIEGEEATAAPKQAQRKKPSHHKPGKGIANVSTTPVPVQVASPVAPTTKTSVQRGAAQAGTYTCKYSCPLCAEKHYPYHCEVFKAYTAPQRKEHVRLHSLCTNCLKAGHAPSECRSTYKCKTCRGNHNSLLHEDQTIPSVSVSVATNPPVCTTNATTKVDRTVLQDCLLMTSQVLVTGPTGTTILARALLDSGSTLSIVSDRVQRVLELKPLGNEVKVQGVGSASESDCCPLTNVVLTSNYQPDWSHNLTVAVMKRVTRNIPIRNASAVREMPHLQGIKLADEKFDMPSPVDILLGQDIWQKLFLPGEATGPKGTPAAWHTVFGWVILGQFTPEAPVHVVAAAAHVVESESEPDGDFLLKKFWELEEPPKSKEVFTPEERRVEQHYKETHVYLPNERRYQVKLPRIISDLQLGDSKTQAVHRARHNERSLMRKKVWPAFQEVMKEYLELGHAQPVTQADLEIPPSECYYMPVHSVFKQSSSTTKVRAVFDASARSTTNVSFNDLLAVGPTIQPTLQQTLLRFRGYKIALSGDITKMYREISLAPEERSFHRFIWREKETDPWTEFQMNRVTFGVTASPYIAIKTLQQAARDFGGDMQSASHHIEESFYVDDFFGGAKTVEQAVILQQEMRAVLDQAGFRLRKWRSSSSQVLEQMPSEILEAIPEQELVDVHSATYPKALGLNWDSRQDTMSTSVSLSSVYSPTKRGVIRDIAKTFDVLGWLSPVVLPMKVLYRELWIRKLDWDQEVPDQLKEQHLKWRNELQLLVKVRLPRHYFEKKTPLNVSLHGFSDASKVAFTGVVYIRATYASGQPSSHIVLSKTKVAPIEERTIPELELCGAHLLAKLMTSVSQTLNVPAEHMYCYSDSTITLAWLDGSPQRNRLYVANRISKTTRLIKPSAWNYVPTAENPADCSSRGLTAQELLDHHLWWHGPDWLIQDPVQIPIKPNTTQPTEEEDPVEETPNQQCNLVIPQVDDLIECRSNVFSKLIRITCWVKRFIHRTRYKIRYSSRQLTVAEGIAAEDFLRQRSQARSFPLELHRMKANPPVELSSKSKLLALHPCLSKEGLLCVGGRLRNSNLEEGQKHPVILSSKDIFTKLLLTHYHLELMHAGPTAIISHSGKQHYIIGIRRLARTVCSSCITCRKAATKAGPQLMGQLPSTRLNPDYVFYHTGIDFAGPFTTRAGHTRKPVYLKTTLAIFVCFHTKAVHLELVRDQTTASFVAALTRFISRRGLPITIHSDNGPNLVGARNELSEFYKMMESDETQNAVQAYLLDQKVTWDNIPQRSPHFGGLWEAAVKAAKYHLKRVMGNQILTYDELETVICQVEACLNSRPLGCMISHPIDSLCPLTPGHFLIGRALRAYPAQAASHNPGPLQRWDKGQKMINQFWKRWTQEYLQQLQRAVKWHRKNRNFCVGDMVMMTDGSVFQCQWSMAKVVAVYPGRDGVVRTVDVQIERVILPKNWNSNQELSQQITTRTAVYRRPVHKLAMLLAVEEVPSECQVMAEDTPEEHLSQ